MLEVSSEGVVHKPAQGMFRDFAPFPAGPVAGRQECSHVTGNLSDAGQDRGRAAFAAVTMEPEHISHPGPHGAHD